MEKKIGGVHFEIAESPFGAYAKFSNKTIYLSPKLFENDKFSLNALQSALFEIANLSQESVFDSLLGRIRKMTPDEFVSEYEKIEHKSALIAKRILRETVPQNQWVDCALAFTPEKFSLHYLFQQAAGHSQEIWKRHERHFDPAATYRGTWESPIRPEEKDYVYALIDLRARSLDFIDAIKKRAEKDYRILRGAIMERKSLQHLAGRVHEIEGA